MWLLAVVFLLIFVLPISAYLTVKFGWVGYFRAKQRQQKKEKNNAES